MNRVLFYKTHALNKKIIMNIEWAKKGKLWYYAEWKEGKVERSADHSKRKQRAANWKEILKIGKWKIESFKALHWA